MSPMSLQVTYRKGRPFAAYLYVDRRPGEKSFRSEEMGPGLIVDFSSDGRTLGLEIVNPDITSVEQILAVFDGLGIGRPDPAHLAPLVAA